MNYINLSKMIKARAAKYGRREALKYRDYDSSQWIPISWNDFDETVDICANALVEYSIKEQENIIKRDYPKFMRSKRFKEFEKYIKKSDAKYLLKYDRIKLIRGFWRKDSRIYTIDTIENDFPDMPEAFAAYIRLKSYQKKQARISAKINKSKKYYARPTELFARFVEGLYLDKEYAKKLAPTSAQIFNELLDKGYYKDLATLCRTYLHI